MKTLTLSLFFCASLFAQVPVTITFSVPSSANLSDVEHSRFQQVSPSAIGTLTSATTSAATSIAVSGACPVNNTAIYVDAEPMLVTAGSGTQTCTVTRNSALSAAGTTAAAHSLGAAIAQLRYVNAQAYFVDVAVAQFLAQVTTALGSNSAVIGTASQAVVSNQANINTAVAATVVAQ